MIRTRLHVVVDAGTARRLPAFGYTPHAADKVWDAGHHTTWTSAHSVSAAPHLNAAAADGAHAVWTSSETAYVEGTRRIARETRVTYLKASADPDADGPTTYVRTTITREA